VANAYNYSNTAVQTTLGGNISNSATSFTVAATTGFPASTPYVLALDYGAASEELVVVTGVAGTTLTVTRAFSGTSAQSHSIGAVVRHVYNAQDAIDFRTHEAATADVHGVTGALVGATQAQTLTNKTLTTPTINGATMSGTFAGAHTYSGAVTMSGGGTLSGTFTGAPTLSGAVVLSGTPSISNGAALSGTFSGTHTYSGAVTLSGGATFTASAPLSQGATSGTTTFRSTASGDAADRFQLKANGLMEWGDGTAARDTNLYRSAANTLATDDSLAVGGGLTAGSTTWTTYVPAVTGSGSAAWSTRTGYYYKLGKMVFVVAYLVVSGAGTGSNNVTIDMPSTVDRTTRQVLTASVEGMGLNGHSHCVFFTGGTGGTVDRIRSYDGQNLIGSDLFVNGILTVQGWYREA
jgi:hypothetical protein